ncbi:MAG: glycoside hydrolase [Firmicutes bacterium]|nr:glycoside hydrolase [Bacillota bacterium]
MGSRLYVSVLWHMHQPCYKDLRQGRYILPWVRLHGIKSYYDMGKIVAEVQGAKANFNFVPSLLVQLLDYAGGEGRDLYLEYTEKDPSEMTYGEKLFLLQNFFHANFDNLIRPYPRYLQLWEKRDGYDSWEHKLARFNHQDIMDLQVWFNLAWFGYLPKTRDPELKELILKGENYTAGDKEVIINKQRQIIRELIPLYQQLQAEGVVELSTTPFYHPILPLLCDTCVARESQSDVPLPAQRFAFPEDADRQIREAIEFHQEIFGTRPAGMWPSEGAVSRAALELMATNGISWTASDEEILGRTLYQQGFCDWDSREWLYQPYQLELSDGSLNIFFRDHHISDLIGFVYHRWHTNDAIGDLIHRLRQLKGHLPDGRSHLVSIILDGENAWEHYHNNGYDFLTGIYRALVDHPELELVTFSEYLARFGTHQTLRTIFPGSWIGANFATWIGQKPKNRAWEYLARARNDLVRLSRQQPASTEDQELAWRSMLMAEGSDWFWWFGDTHSSALDAEFDELFRRHLINVYRSFNWEPPAFLERPVAETGAIDLVNEPVGYIWPVIDGRETSSDEWLAAGSLDLTKGSVTMQRANYLFERLWFGFNDTYLFIRLDGAGCQWLKGAEPDLRESYGEEPRIIFQVVHDNSYLIEVCAQPGKLEQSARMKVELRRQTDGAAEHVTTIKQFGLEQVLELAIPLSDLGLVGPRRFALAVIIANERGELEKWPAGAPLWINLPGLNTTSESRFSAGGRPQYE